jgi:hypothetical protein
MSRRRVDFPQPLGPMRETNSPASTTNEIPDSAKVRTAALSGAGKLLFTSRARSEEASLAASGAAIVTI